MENGGNKILEGLNPAQAEAVAHLEGPSLIIAGAGSGKTKVLTCKIANILDSGYAPWSVLAVTFTNKASREMRERIGRLVGERRANRIYMGTFHSVFLRFLRQYARLLGFPPGFTIYDKSDVESLLKRCIKNLQLDDKVYKPRDISGRISECKNRFITPDAYLSDVALIESDRRSKKPRLQEVYALYVKSCEQQGVMDFDDILLNMYRLSENFPEVFAQIRERFRFILVDEYQDTNHLQYLILRSLAKDHRNITVVGDDAQSIYGFRGARIENILNFSKDYPEAKIFRLERNYRSTQTIVAAANSVINKNSSKLAKTCYSEREQGEKIEILNTYTEQEEAVVVAAGIMRQMFEKHAQYKDFAILYRTNGQSRVLEEALRKKNMPYKIFAGHSFYERAEIKTMISYLRLIVNPLDDEAFKRVINFPTRGIGATSMEKVIGAAALRQCSICDLIRVSAAEELGIRMPTFLKLKEFVDRVDRLRAMLPVSDAYEVARAMDDLLGITSALRTDLSLDGQSRLDNVMEFFNSVKEFVDEGTAEYERFAQPADGGVSQDGSDDDAAPEDPPLITLDLYLQNIALISDSDSAQSSSDVNKPNDDAVRKNDNRISLMTVHSSKGLEFPYVYITGMEENLFPSGGTSGVLSVKDLEEERRLFYVAVTRAENAVKLSWSRVRMKWGTYTNNYPSRFIREIDPKYLKNPLSATLPDMRNDGFGGGFGRGSGNGFGGGGVRRSDGYSGCGSTGGNGSTSSTGGRYGQENRYGTSGDRHGDRYGGRYGGGGKFQGRQQEAAGSVSVGGRRFAVSQAPAPSFTQKGELRPKNENFVPSSPLQMRPGQRVEHERFGYGKIVSMSGKATELKAVVEFENNGTKTLLLKFAKMRIVE